jgi:hypothetical protein
MRLSRKDIVAGAVALLLVLVAAVVSNCLIGQAALAVNCYAGGRVIQFELRIAQ